MRMRALDRNNDWTFGKGKQNYQVDVEALKLHIKTRIKSWKGNCFFAEREGVDWNSYLDVGTKDFLDRDISRTILQTDGVIKIKTFNSELEDRNLTISCEIVSVYGNIFIEEAL